MMSDEQSKSKHRLPLLVSLLFLLTVIATPHVVDFPEPDPCDDVNSTGDVTHETPETDEPRTPEPVHAPTPPCVDGGSRDGG